MWPSDYSVKYLEKPLQEYSYSKDYKAVLYPGASHLLGVIPSRERNPLLYKMIPLAGLILNYCWFMALYVDMGSKDDEIAYAVEGEGDWGENIGFVINNDRVIYVGADYLDYMKNAK